MLIAENTEDFTLLRAVETDDGYGSYTTDWQEIQAFRAAITQDSTGVPEQAEKDTTSEPFTVYTSRDIVLKFHDVIRRSDGLTLRILSNGDEIRTPPSAGLDLRAVDAERWEIPGGEDYDE